VDALALVNGTSSIRRQACRGRPAALGDGARPRGLPSFALRRRVISLRAAVQLRPRRGSACGRAPCARAGAARRGDRSGRLANVWAGSRPGICARRPARAKAAFVPRPRLRLGRSHVAQRRGAAALARAGAAGRACGFRARRSAALGWWRRCCGRWAARRLARREPCMAHVAAAFAAWERRAPRRRPCSLCGCAAGRSVRSTRGSGGCGAGREVRRGSGRGADSTRRLCGIGVERNRSDWDLRWCYRLGCGSAEACGPADARCLARLSAGLRLRRSLASARRQARPAAGGGFARCTRRSCSVRRSRWRPGRLPGLAPAGGLALALLALALLALKLAEPARLHALEAACAAFTPLLAYAAVAGYAGCGGNG